MVIIFVIIYCYAFTEICYHFCHYLINGTLIVNEVQCGRSLAINLRKFYQSGKEQSY